MSNLQLIYIVPQPMPSNFKDKMANWIWFTASGPAYAVSVMTYLYNNTTNADIKANIQFTNYNQYFSIWLFVNNVGLNTNGWIASVYNTMNNQLITLTPGKNLISFYVWTSVVINQVGNIGGLAASVSTTSGTFLFHTDSTWYCVAVDPYKTTLSTFLSYYDTPIKLAITANTGAVFTVNMTPFKSANSSITNVYNIGMYGTVCVSFVATVAAGSNCQYALSTTNCWNTTPTSLTSCLKDSYAYWIWYNQNWNIPGTLPSVSTSAGISPSYYFFYLYNNVNNYNTVYACFSSTTGCSLYINGNSAAGNPYIWTQYNVVQMDLLKGYNIIVFQTSYAWTQNSTLKGLIGTFWYNASTPLFHTDSTWFYTSDSTINTSITNCLQKNVASVCSLLFNYVGLNTYSQLGYSCFGEYVGKVNSTNNAYIVASNKSVPITECKKIINKASIQGYSPMETQTCKTYTEQITKTNPNLCQQAFTSYNLYPSTNPLVITGNNIYEGVKSSFSKNPSALTTVYNTYKNNFPVGTTNTPTSLTEGLNTVLNEHALKWGCCMANKGTTTALSVNERVPLNPNVTPSAEDKKFNFQYQNLAIPAESCPSTYYNGSPNCNSFFQLNCSNIMNYMEQEKISVESQLLNYAPECACYAPNTTTAQKQYASQNVPSICYKLDCTTGYPSTYIDPSSRADNGSGPAQACSATYCNNIVQINDVQANSGKNTTISPQLQNECGSYLKTGGSGTNTTGGTTNTTGGSTNTTGGSTNTTGGSTNTTGTTNTANSSDASSSSTSIIIIVIIVIIILILLSCSAYLYFNSKKKANITNTM